MPVPECTVIIPNWNGWQFLERCLDCLRLQSHSDFEIVVVDNGSTDDSVDMIRSHWPEVRVERLERNQGFAAAANRGISVAAGEYVALLNNDTEPEPDWLAELLEAVREHADVGLADSKIIRLDDPACLDSCGEIYSRWGFPSPRGRGDEERRYREPADVFGVCGAALLAHREVLERVGCLDESFFMYYEDIDLSFRARLAGYRCLNVPSSRVLHHVGGSSGGLTPSVRYHALKNMLLLYLKNMPPRLFWRLLPRFLIVQAILFVSSCLHLQPGAPLRAYAYVLRNTRTIRSERKRIEAARRADDATVYAAMDPGFPAALLPSPLRKTP